MSNRQDVVRQIFESLPRRRVLVTGAEGMLGRSFVRCLKTIYPQAEVLAFGHSEFDVTDRDKVLAFSKLEESDWVVHCAALVNVEKCETQEGVGRSQILEGTRNVVDLAVRSGAQFFYPQSFLIYDGVTNPIDEQTEPHPLSVYGQMKLAAENYTLSKIPGALIVRMAGFFGGEEKDKNFVGLILPRIMERINKGDTEFEVGDRIWQPTWTDDLALNSLALLGLGKSGHYQMSCHGTATFFDLAVAMLELLGLDKKITIKKIPATAQKLAEIGKRPPKAILATQKLMSENLDFQRHWREALAEYLQHPYFDRYRNFSEK